MQLQNRNYQNMRILSSLLLPALFLLSDCLNNQSAGQLPFKDVKKPEGKKCTVFSPKKKFSSINCSTIKINSLSDNGFLSNNNFEKR